MPDTGQPQNNFFRMRRLKQMSSGLGGTGNYTEGTESDNTEVVGQNRPDENRAQTSFHLSGGPVTP